MGIRKSGFDVTGILLVRDSAIIENAVVELYKESFSNAPCQIIRDAFDLFNQSYAGLLKEFMPCDMLYHDEEHVLEVTLATARLIYGLQKTSKPFNQYIHKLDKNLAIVAIVIALFHDSGYLKNRHNETEVINGSVFTKTHVSRSSDMLFSVMAKLGLKQYTRIATEAVHYTGYEKKIKSLDLQNDIERIVGCLVGTADYIGQMSDRRYLEKCYSRLYPELVLGKADQYFCDVTNQVKTLYKNRTDLITKSNNFYKNVVRPKLEFDFHSVYHLADAIFPEYGVNLYMWWMENNQRELVNILSNQLEIKKLLRRKLIENRGVKVFPYHLIPEEL
ncbi:MAG: hypothetical protein QM538_04375 [Methylacidiphilales bacterium]|nr:hypothetical protein [Candidatus Methylacidiphilales bacterium]